MVNYKKILNYNDLLFTSLGHILGAGIYTIIGKLSYHAGYYSYISIILAGIFVIWLAKSYININEKYTTNDAEYRVIEDNFGSPIADKVIFGTILGNIVACIILAIAFGGYLSKLLKVSVTFGIFICIFICTLISSIGIKQTANINIIITLLEISGLFVVILCGFMFSIQKVKHIDIIKHIKNLFTVNTIYKIFIGIYLILFAYFGFESLIKLSEESINPKEDIPLSINNSLIISTIIYTLVSFSALSIMTPTELGNSIAPLSDVLRKIPYGNITSKYLAFTAVGSTFNTYLIILTGTSRLLVSIIKKYKSKNNQVQKIYNMLTRLDSKKHTPINCNLFITIIIIMLILLKLNFTFTTIISTTCLLITIVFVKISDTLNQKK